jgi:translation elongation factor EF-4
MMHVPVQVDRLYAGEVGYLAASIKAVADAKVGDTITLKKHGASEPLAGYREVVPMVFCGLFPTDADQFGDLREALGRLQLNDAALSYEPEVSCCLLSVQSSEDCSGLCHAAALHEGFG